MFKLSKEWRAWTDWERMDDQEKYGFMSYKGWLKYGPYCHPKFYITNDWTEDD